MEHYKVRPFQLKDIDAITELEQLYKTHFPDATYSWTSAYLFNPNLGYGDHIFCLVNEQDQLLGNGHVYTLPASHADQEHKFFLYIKVNPELQNHYHMQTLLYETLLNHSKEMLHKLNPANPSTLYVQYFASETALLTFFYEKGFIIHRQHEVKLRALDCKLPTVPIIDGVHLTTWVPKTTNEKQKYLEAKRKAFPDASLTIDDLDFQMQAPYWALTSAFTEDQEIVGSIMLLQPPWEDNKVFTEDIFVLPGKKHKGIARAMNIYAFHHLKHLGYSYAMLTVDNKNIPAKTLCESIGYQTDKEEMFLKKPLNTADSI